MTLFTVYNAVSQATVVKTVAVSFGWFKSANELIGAIEQSANNRRALNARNQSELRSSRNEICQYPSAMYNGRTATNGITAPNISRVYHAKQYDSFYHKLECNKNDLKIIFITFCNSEFHSETRHLAKIARLEIEHYVILHFVKSFVSLGQGRHRVKPSYWITYFHGKFVQLTGIRI